MSEDKKVMCIMSKGENLGMLKEISLKRSEITQAYKDGWVRCEGQAIHELSEYPELQGWMCEHEMERLTNYNGLVVGNVTETINRTVRFATATTGASLPMWTLQDDTTSWTMRTLDEMRRTDREVELRERIDGMRQHFLNAEVRPPVAEHSHPEHDSFYAYMDRLCRMYVEEDRTDNPGNDESRRE